MKNLIVLILIFIPSLIFSQASISWVENASGVSIALDNSDNVYTIDQENIPAGDIILTKRGSGGNLIWQRKYDQTDSTKREKAVFVTTDFQGNAIVTGNLLSGNTITAFSANIIMKFDPSGNLLWRNVHENSTGASYTKKCIADADNNIYVLGSGSSVQNTSTTKVWKFNPSGNLIWTFANSTATGIGAAVNFKFTPDNCIVISTRYSTGNLNGFIKIDLNGIQKWILPGIYSLNTGDAAGDSYGNTYIVNGSIAAVTSGTVIRKLNSTGVTLWSRSFGLSAQRIEVGSDNMPVAAGTPGLNTLGTAFVKTDQNGNQIWLNSNADGNYNLLIHTQLMMDSQNNAYISGGTTAEMAVCKVSSVGASAWTVTIPGSYANGFDIGADYGVYLTGGKTAKINQGVSCPVPQNLFTNEITRTTAKVNWSFVTGALQYEILYRSLISPSITNAWLRKIVSGNVNFAVLTGLRCNNPYHWKIRAICDTVSPSIGMNYSALQNFTTSPCGNEMETLDKGIEGNETENLNSSIPNTAFLGNNYPNPFNPVTKIEFGIPNSGNVVINIFDVSGKEVASIFNGFREAGNYSVEFNAFDYSSGVYFYKMVFENSVIVKKMLILK